MRKKIYRIVSFVAFQIGVTVIGLPDFHYVQFLDYKKQIFKSKFHR